MSFLLYNPMEAAVILLCVYVFKINSIDNDTNNCSIKKFIVQSYMLGWLLLSTQIPINYLTGLIFVVYTIFVNFLMAPLITRLVCELRGDMGKYFLVVSLYSAYSNVLTKIFRLPMVVQEICNNSIVELVGNVMLRATQCFTILIFIIGGKILKKFLAKSAKKNVANTIAPTMNGWGEPKLSKKLQDEIK